MPQGLSDDQNCRHLQNAHNMETVYPLTKNKGHNAANRNLMKNKQRIYENQPTNRNRCGITPLSLWECLLSMKGENLCH